MVKTEPMKRTFAFILAAVGIGWLVAAVADDTQTKPKTAKDAGMTNAHSATISVRYMIDDVDAAVAFYTNHLGFILDLDSAPAFASVTRGNLRLLISGEKSSGRRPMAD